MTRRADERTLNGPERSDGERDRQSTASLGTRAAALDGRSVLVTGSGPLARRVAAELVDACDVTVLDDFAVGDPDALPADATVVRGDVRDVETVATEMAGTDVAVHLSGLSTADRSVRAPLECHGRTASGAVQVLDAARRRDARVVVGSSAAVNDRSDPGPVRETGPTGPGTPYAVATLAADEYARRYADLYDLPVTVLRYFDVYGGAPDHGLVDRLAVRAAAGEPLVLPGPGGRRRDVVHVDDAARATLLAAVDDGDGQAVNVGSGQGPTLREIAERVRKAAGVDTEIVEGGSTGNGVPGPAALERARGHLGYEPTVTLEDGIRAVVDEARPERVERV